MLKRVIAAHREGAGVGKEAALFSRLNVLPRFQMQLSVSSASCHSVTREVAVSGWPFGKGNNGFADTRGSIWWERLFRKGP